MNWNKPMKNGKFYTVAREILRPFMHIVFPYTVIGREHLPQSGGYILASNHKSYIDPFYLEYAASPRQIRFMAKQELFGHFGLKQLITMLGAFMVTRGREDAGALNRGAEIVRQGGIVGIFPEGTRGYENPPSRAKAGIAVVASRCEGDVIPVCIVTKQQVKPFRRVKVVIGPKISHQDLRLPDDPTTKDLKRVANLIMERITALWDEHAIDDELTTKTTKNTKN